MIVEHLEIPDLILITPKKWGDERGFFSEVWNHRSLESLGIEVDFVQDNHSWSSSKGVLRGLHFQSPPYAQDKLVRCSRGRILDVAVDIRAGSSTFGRYVAVELSAENWRQLFVPKGFAHGFLTMEADTEVQYKVSEYYAPEHDETLRWDDAELSIDWGLGGQQPILSDKDLTGKTLSECSVFFSR